MIFVLWVLVAVGVVAMSFASETRSNIELTRLFLEEAQRLYGSRGVVLYAFHKLQPSLGTNGAMGQANTNQAEQESGESDTNTKKTSLDLPPILKQLPMFKDLANKLEEDNDNTGITDDETSGSAESGQDGVTGEASLKEDAPYWSPATDPYEVKIGSRGYFVWVTCENGKLNINLASSEMLKEFFRHKGLSPVETTIVVNSILDWIDKDDQSRFQGAESSYYNTLSTPYPCKNAFFENIEELMLVRGITPAIFTSIRDDITVFGLSAKININFASEAVLTAVPGMPPAAITEILFDRKNQGAFENLDRIKEITSPWFDEVQPYLTVEKGDFFSITASPENSKARTCLIVSDGTIIRSYFF